MILYEVMYADSVIFCHALHGHTFCRAAVVSQYQYAGTLPEYLKAIETLYPIRRVPYFDVTINMSINNSKYSLNLDYSCCNNTG